MIEVRADDTILPADTRSLEVEFHNGFNYTLARRTGLGFLKDSLKDIYKGNLIIIGNEKIKPLDVVIVMDKQAGLYGPIEVEEVEHMYSAETGFITNIVPDLCVGVGNFDGLIITAAINHYFTGQGIKWGDMVLGEASEEYKGKELLDNQSKLNPSNWSLLASTLNPAVGITLPAWLVGNLADQIGIWYRGFTEVHEPTIALPLVKNSQPYLSGLKGYSRDNNVKMLTVNGWLSFAEAYHKLSVAQNRNNAENGSN
jgi:hypothetical protein